MMLHLADSFVESVAAQAGQLSKLRGSSVLDAKDVAYVLGKDATCTGTSSFRT